MNELFNKTFDELTTPEPLDIRGLGDSPLDAEQISFLFSVVNYRFENLLPTTTYTERKPMELSKALCNEPECETLAYAIVGRLWEMGVERSAKEAQREKHTAALPSPAPQKSQSCSEPLPQIRQSYCSEPLP